MRDLWDRIGRPDAISWVSVVVAVPVMLAANIAGSGIDPREWGAEILLAGSLGGLALVGVLGLGKATVLRGRDRPSRPVRTLAVFVAALAARAWVFDAAVRATDAADTSRVLYRFLSSFDTVGAALVLTAYSVSLARDVSRDAAALQEVRAQTRALAAGVEDRLARRRAELVDHIRDLLTRRLTAGVADPPEQVLVRLRDTIETVVRPISHALTREVAEVTEVRAGPDPPRRIEVRAVLRGATGENPFRPLWMATWTGVTHLLFAPMVADPRAVLGSTPASFLTVWGLLSLASLAWDRTMPGRGAGVRALAYTGVLVAVVMLTIPVIDLFPAGSFDVYAVRWPMLALWTVSGWVLALMLSLRREHRRTGAALDRERSRLREELVRLTTAELYQRRAIGRALHGPVQDALAAAGFRLAAAVESGTATRETVDHLRATILSSLQLVENPEDPHLVLEALLADTVELWDGLCRVSWVLGPGVRAVLADHPVSTQSVADIVREACSNAIRHGEADRVDIAVTLEGDRLVVAVTDDGRGLSLGSAAGYGTRLFDELTLRWSLQRTDGEQAFRAELPVM